MSEQLFISARDWKNAAKKKMWRALTEETEAGTDEFKVFNLGHSFRVTREEAEVEASELALILSTAYKPSPGSPGIACGRVLPEQVEAIDAKYMALEMAFLHEHGRERFSRAEHVEILGKAINAVLAPE